MMATLPPAILPRVGSLLRLLGSDQDGEALGAARALKRTLGGAGFDLHALADLVEHPPRSTKRRQRATAEDCVGLSPTKRRDLMDALQDRLDGSNLTEWEVGFAVSIMGRLRSSRPTLTRRQIATAWKIIQESECSRW